MKDPTQTVGQEIVRHNPTQKSKEIMSLPGKEAMERILDSFTPAHLVQSLAPEDLYWLVQDIGPEDALPILARATSEQWQYVLDLELWHKDRLDFDALHYWLPLLLRADPQRLIAWGIDQNATVISFHLFDTIEVKIREENESASEFDEGYFSFDGTFYIRVREDRYYEPIYEFLRRLAEYDLNELHRVLIELSGFVPWESEEELYRLRNVRLAERGYLPHEEAIAIYQYLDGDTLVHQTSSNVPSFRGPETHNNQLPVSTWLSVDNKDRFHQSIMALKDPAEVEHIQHDFAVMCNQIIAADGMQARTKEDLLAVVKKACGYLDLGLEKIAGPDADTIVSSVKRFPLDRIFRVGYGLGLELKWKAQRWVQTAWFISQGLDTSFWEPPWAGMLDGLLMRQPLYYTEFKEGGEPYREFRTLAEVDRYQRHLDRLVALDQLLSRIMTDQSLESIEDTHQGITYKNLLLTMWARHQLDLGHDPSPLTDKQLTDVFHHLRASKRPPFQLDAAMREAFLGWAAKHGQSPDGGIGGMEASLKDSLHRLLDELETEYAYVSLNDLDPRYVGHFLVYL